MAGVDLAAQPLWLSLALFVTAAGAVWLIGSRLTRCIDAIADRTRMDRAFAGMLLLGGITSLPEVANVATSSSIGNPELGVNNLLGSAGINVLLLAVGDAFLGRTAATGIVVRPSVLMMATLCILVLILIAGAVTLEEFAIMGVGIGSVTICAASLGAFWLATGYDRRSPWALGGEDVRKSGKVEAHYHSTTDRALWTRVALLATAIFLAGYLLSRSGDAIAVQTGVGSAMVGFLLIGAATSLPELSTIVTALRIHRPEMAFGQVLGTNFINLSLILLADLIYRGGPVIDRLGTFETISALLAALLIGIFLVGLLEHRDRTLFRMGYDSVAVILTFLAGFALLAAFTS